MEQIQSVLIVGATGSIGSLAVEQAVKQGFQVSALVRNVQRANFDKSVQLIQGDLTKPLILDGVDAVIFTQGSYNSQLAKSVDYNGVRNVLMALRDKPKRIALMTSIYATSDRENSHWKRRAERLVRASNIPYTIIRPSWFDTNQSNQRTLLLTQYDSKHQYKFTSQDGGVSRCQIAETLVKSLQMTYATNRTVELISTLGSQTTNFDMLFTDTKADVKQPNFDGIHDPNNLPLEHEPQVILDDLNMIQK